MAGTKAKVKLIKMIRTGFEPSICRVQGELFNRVSYSDAVKQTALERLACENELTKKVF